MYDDMEPIKSSVSLPSLQAEWLDKNNNEGAKEQPI